jgi:6-phosphogluconolactonase (cycloisomerase 2 family)
MDTWITRSRKFAVTLAVAGLLLAPSGARAGCYFDWDGSDAVFDNQFGHMLELTESVAVSPDGNYVYATSRNDDAVTVFSRNTTTGDLTFVQAKQDGVSGVDGLNGASGITISSDGAYVYVAGRVDDAVAIFSRNSSTGQLTYISNVKDGVGGVDGLNGAVSIALDPGEDCAYVAGTDDNAVAVFNRNTSTGALTYVEAEKDEMGAPVVHGLNGASAVISSSDGNQVYASSSTDDSVVVLARESPASNCRIMYSADFKDGTGGVDGLNGAISLTLSPDQAHLYVAGQVDDKVARFSRNSSTGALTFGGVTSGIDGATGIAIASDNVRVFVTSRSDNSVRLYRRDTSTGVLTIDETKTDGSGTVDGLGGAHGIALTSGHIYVTGDTDDAVAWFQEFDDNGDTCNDSNACTSGEVCDGAGNCGSGTCLTGQTGCACPGGTCVSDETGCFCQS